LARPLGVLTTSYPTHPGSGAGTFVRGFCVACARAGWPVEVLCPEPAADLALPADPGVRVRPLAYFRPRRAQFLSASPGAPEALAAHPALWLPGLAYSARLTAAALSGRRRYGALVSHWLVPGALCGALGTDLPHLAIAHGSDVHLLSRLPAGRAVARWLVRQGVAFAFVSEALRERFAALLTPVLREALHGQSLVQPMGVDVADVASGDRATGRARHALEGPVVLWMGRLTALKRPSLALALAEALPEVTLVMAGTGPDEAALRRQAAPLGRRVRLVGWVDASARRDLFAAADVALITSTAAADGRSEGLPVAALEALAAGLPLAATRVGGLGELAALEAPVRLVADGDLAGLVRACRDLLAAGRPDAAQRARLARALDWQTVLPRLLALLSRYTGSHGARTIA
jgi:glycosyltransferase involved in cell wall biosynthesis